jgi:MFS family permease
VTSTAQQSGRLPRPFAVLLAASGISSGGDGVRLAAFPLLALTITSEPVAVSSLAIANRLPWLLVSLFSGAIADRYNRRTLMWGVDVVRGLIVALLALAVILKADHLVILYIVAVALGVGETIFTTAAQGLLPDLVAGPLLPKANGRLMTLQMVGSNFVGPVLGSWLFSLSRTVPFVLDALSFFIGSALLSRLPRAATARDSGSSTSLLNEIGSGIRWVIKHPLLRSFLFVVTIVNFTQSASQSILILLAVREIGMSSSAYGLLLAAGGIGAFLGGMLSARIGSRLGVAHILLPGIAITGPLFLLMALAREPLLLGTALAVNSFVGLLANVQMAALRQRIVPRDRISRVSSVNMFFSFGFAIPAGALAAGLLAHAAGVRAVYVGCAAVVAVLTIAVTRDLRPRAVARTIAAVEAGH